MPLSTIGRFASAAGMQIVGAVGTLLGVSIIFFVLTDWLPGDFASATASRDTLIESQRYERPYYLSQRVF